MRKLALITGGTSGIGFSSAMHAAAMGYDLYLIYRSNHAKAEEAKRGLNDKFPNIDVVTDCFDLSSNSGLTSFIEKLDIVMAKQQIEVFISSHGRSIPGIFLQQKMETILSTVTEHLISNLHITHKLLSKMCVASYGRMVFIGSLSSHRINRGQADYALSKAALETFVKSLSAEYSHRNITFNCICPGIALTEITRNIFDNLDEKTQKMFVPVEQIAALIGMLIDKKTTHINGSTFRIDGGQLFMNNNFEYHKIKFHVDKDK